MAIGIREPLGTLNVLCSSDATTMEADGEVLFSE